MRLDQVCCTRAAKKAGLPQGCNAGCIQDAGWCDAGHSRTRGVSYPCRRDFDSEEDVSLLRLRPANLRSIHCS